MPIADVRSFLKNKIKNRVLIRLQHLTKSPVRKFKMLDPEKSGVDPDNRGEPGDRSFSQESPA
jgi:hypothetical protein